VLDKTPFYAESGGQVGDSGTLTFKGSAVQIQIVTTKKENDLIVHFTNDDIEEIFSSLGKNYAVIAKIDVEKRKLIANNHTATHLLQSALRQVLGNHVQQKGSLVNSDLLRFDFAHFAKMTDQELSKVENIVNQKIRENIVLDEKRNIPLAEALKMGATALFGEKYGDTVRVITFDPAFSVELCGGTHVSSTGEIGIFKLVSEGSVAAGVRRIEAITSEAALRYFNQKLNTLESISILLKNPKDIVKAVESLIDEKAILLKKIESFEQAQLKEEIKNQKSKVKNINGINFVAEHVMFTNADIIKTLAFELRNQVENLFAVFTAQIDGKPHIAVAISDSLVQTKGLNASNIVRELAKEVQGGGGGQPFFATAGGKDAGGLPRVLEKARKLV
jgi:alanyl-tRNA synthetase